MMFVVAKLVTLVLTKLFDICILPFIEFICACIFTPSLSVFCVRLRSETGGMGISRDGFPISLFPDR